MLPESRIQKGAIIRCHIGRSRTVGVLMSSRVIILVNAVMVVELVSRSSLGILLGSSEIVWLLKCVDKLQIVELAVAVRVQGFHNLCWTTN